MEKMRKEMGYRATPTRGDDVKTLKEIRFKHGRVAELLNKDSTPDFQECQEVMEYVTELESAYTDLSEMVEDLSESVENLERNNQELQTSLEREGLTTITVDLDEKTEAKLRYLSETTGFSLSKVMEYLLADQIMKDALKNYSN